MNFNLNATTGAKEAGSVLSAGIHNATFKGISKDSINGKDGNVYDVMTLTLDVEGYGEFKLAVGEAVVSVLKPLQDEFARLSKDKAFIDSVIKENAEKAGYYANKTLRKVQKKVGFPERIR